MNVERANESNELDTHASRRLELIKPPRGNAKLVISIPPDFAIPRGWIASWQMTERWLTIVLYELLVVGFMSDKMGVTSSIDFCYTLRRPLKFGDG